MAGTVRLGGSIFCVIIVATALWGCAAQGPDAVMIPDLDSRFGGLEPVLIVTPLVSVYENEISGDVGVDEGLSMAVARESAAVLTEQLTMKGWRSGSVSGVFDWAGLSAGRELGSMTPSAEEPLARKAAAVLQELDRIGRKIRINEKIEGVRYTEKTVPGTDGLFAAGEYGSFLFAEIIGCDGVLRDGPCRNIQMPPFHAASTRTLYSLNHTVPLGMAVRVYWVDAADGRLLWYDDAAGFNLWAGSTGHVRMLVNGGLAEFPQKQ